MPEETRILQPESGTEGQRSREWNGESEQENTTHCSSNTVARRHETRVPGLKRA